MRLTPADVHNVAFKKPSIGKRGYDEDEVDAFLDLVEAELSRLIEENNELTQRVNAAQAGGFVAGTATDAEPADRAGGSAAGAGPGAGGEHDHEAKDGAASVEQAAPAVPANVQAARLLGLAQETAVRLTTEAEADAAYTRATAQAESEKLVGDAQTEAHRLVSEAQGKSDTMVREATARAEALERDSRIKADAMDREAQEKYAKVMGQLTEQRTELEKKIDDLRVYEREYRSRLRSWINDHLAQLDEGGTSDSSKQQPVALGAE